MSERITPIDSFRKTEWTIICLNHFSRKLIGFLSEDSTVDNLHFTDRKDNLGIFTKAEANAILKSINDIVEEENPIHRTFEATDIEDWVSAKFFAFEIANVTFE